jgi:DnaJ-class molecular chaperone
LLELYHGCVKKCSVTTQEQHRTGSEVIENKVILEINVKPGWKSGTKVIFYGKGNKMFGCQPSNIVFVIEEKIESSVSNMKRNGDDLIFTQTISLADALLGGAIVIPTLDKRTLTIACPEIIDPTYEKVVAGRLIFNQIKACNSYKTLKGEGMPNKDGSRGNLIIRFDIRFPKHLPLSKKNMIRDILRD